MLLEPICGIRKSRFMPRARGRFFPPVGGERGHVSTISPAATAPGFPSPSSHSFPLPAPLLQSRASIARRAFARSPPHPPVSTAPEVPPFAVHLTGRSSRSIVNEAAPDIATPIWGICSS